MTRKLEVMKTIVAWFYQCHAGHSDCDGAQNCTVFFCILAATWQTQPAHAESSPTEQRREEAAVVHPETLGSLGLASINPSE